MKPDGTRAKFNMRPHFDRPFWDSESVNDRFNTSSASQAKDVESYFMHQKNGTCNPDVEYIAPFQTSTVASRLKTDNVSPLFSYPILSETRSTSADTFVHDSDYEAEIKNKNRRFFIKRNEFSDFNERRIRFGLKF